jgi:hypothetical protein
MWIFGHCLAAVGSFGIIASLIWLFRSFVIPTISRKIFKQQNKLRLILKPVMALVIAFAIGLTGATLISATHNNPESLGD